MSEIKVPLPVLVDTNSLQVDDKNPNRMTREDLNRLKRSIEKFGFIVPIVTNKDLLIADGEQKWIIAKELGMPQVPVVRLPVTDVDRRLLRQVLNKLHGEHDKKLDAEEFKDLIALGAQEDLQYLLALSDDKLEGYFHDIEESSVSYHESFEVIIECKDEVEQEQIYNKLLAEGLKCRVSTL